MFNGMFVMVSLRNSASSFFASSIFLLDDASKSSRKEAIKDSFSDAPSLLKASPSTVISPPGVGIELYLLLTIPSSSLDSAKVYFLIHCIPGALIVE